MRTDPNPERQRAHAYLDLLAADKVPAVAGLLEAMLDPVARSIARAPVENEPLTEEEEAALGEAREWLKDNQPIPHEQVLAELGITQEEIENHPEQS